MNRGRGTGSKRGQANRGYVEVLCDEKATTAAGFLRRAVAFYRLHGISVARHERQRRLLPLSHPCARLPHAGAAPPAHTPYRPRTNRIERFIRTLLAGWAYTAIYGSSAERTTALHGWLWTYNHRRRHRALRHKPPIARLNELNNLARSDS